MWLVGGQGLARRQCLPNEAMTPAQSPSESQKRVKLGQAILTDIWAKKQMNGAGALNRNTRRGTLLWEERTSHDGPLLST